MSAINTEAWNLEDMVRKLGFDADPYHDQWFIKMVHGGTQVVRVCIDVADGERPRVDVHYLDRHYVAEWSVRYSPGTPHSVIRAGVRAAVAR